MWLDVGRIHSRTCVAVVLDSGLDAREGSLTTIRLRRCIVLHVIEAAGSAEAKQQ